DLLGPGRPARIAGVCPRPLPAVARAGRRRRSFAATLARGESRDPLTPASVLSQKFGDQREGGAGGAPAGTVACSENSRANPRFASQRVVRQTTPVSAGGRSGAHDAVARSRRRDARA